MVGRDFVMVALGSKWQGAIVPLQLLAIYAGFRSIMPLFTQLLLAIRDSRFVVLHSVALVLVMPTAFYFAATRWGTGGLAMTWILVYPLLAAVLCWRVFQKIELSPWTYLLSLWPALSSGGIMAAVVLTVRAAAGAGASPGLGLAMEVGSGVITYCLACLVLHRQRIRAFYDLILAARGRKTTSSMTEERV